MNFAFHPKVDNPTRWEIIKREAERTGGDPYEMLKEHVYKERSKLFGDPERAKK